MAKAEKVVELVFDNKVEAAEPAKAKKDPTFSGSYKLGETVIRVIAKSPEALEQVMGMVGVGIPNVELVKRGGTAKQDVLALAVAEHMGSTYEVAKAWIDAKEAGHRGFKRRLRSEHAIAEILLRLEAKEPKSAESLLADFGA